MKETTARKIYIIEIIILVLILFFPIPMPLRDGGSIEFNAVTYQIQIYNKIDLGHGQDLREKGVGISIFGKEIYKNTKLYDEQGNVFE